MANEPRTEQRRRMERQAETERTHGDQTATRPRDVKRVGAIAAAALLIGVIAVVAMFVNNSRYDGTSPIPVSERR